MTEEELWALSEMMVVLAESRMNTTVQRRLTLLTIRQYLDDAANKLSAMWVNKQLDKDDYHFLMGCYRSAWDNINSVIMEDFGEKGERRF